MITRYLTTFLLAVIFCLQSCLAQRDINRNNSDFYEYSLSSLSSSGNEVDLSKVQRVNIDANNFQSVQIKTLQKCIHVNFIRYSASAGMMNVEELQKFQTSIINNIELTDLSFEFDSISAVSGLIKNHPTIEKVAFKANYVGILTEDAFLSTKVTDLALNIKETNSTNVNWSNCPNLVYLNHDIGNENVTIFDNLNVLEQLVYSNNHVSILPDAFFQMPQLISLILNTPKLNELNEKIENLSELKGLTLNNCCSLNALPESIGSLKKLKGIRILNAPRVELIPDNWKNLTGLKLLSIEGSENLTSIMPLFELDSLIELEILGIDPLIFINELIKMKNLTSLGISLYKLYGKEPDQIKQLKKLSIDELHLRDKIFSVNPESNTCEKKFLEEEKTIEVYKKLKKNLPKKFFR